MNNKLKKMISSAVVVALVVTSTAFVSPASASPKALTDSNTSKYDVVVGGKTIAIRTVDISTYREVTEDTINTKVISKEHFDFLPSASIEQKEAFKDSENSFDIKIKGDEYYIDGEKLTEEELKQPITQESLDAPQSFSAPQSIILAAANDSGGIPEISHYYGNYKTYNFFSYNDFKIWTSWGPDGSHVSKTNVSISGPYTSLAISNINAFATSHASMKYNLAQTLIALGVAAVTWETVVGLVGSGLTGAASAAGVVNDRSQARSSLKQAYNYIQRM